MRLVTSVLSTAFSAVLLSAIGCGGGDKGGDTTPASGDMAGDGAGEGAAGGDTTAAGGEATPEGGETAAAGGGLTEQLAQGDKVWADACSSCHGDAGEGKGKKNPPLVGGKALSKFKTGGDLYSFVKEKMPKDDPGTLSEADALAATAWLLNKNAKLGDAKDAITTSSAASLKVE